MSTVQQCTAVVGKRRRPGCLQETSEAPPPRVEPPGQRFYPSSLLTECGDARLQAQNPDMYGVR